MHWHIHLRGSPLSAIVYSSVVIVTALKPVSGQLLYLSSRLFDYMNTFNQISMFLPRDAMHKSGLCRRAVSVRLSVTYVYSVEKNNGMKIKQTDENSKSEKQSKSEKAVQA